MLLSVHCHVFPGFVLFEVEKHKKQNKQITTTKKTCEAWEHLSRKEWGVAKYKIYALKMMMLLVNKLLNIYL